MDLEEVAVVSVEHPEEVTKTLEVADHLAMKEDNLLPKNTNSTNTRHTMVVASNFLKKLSNPHPLSIIYTNIQMLWDLQC
jgi:hypothetical protein